MSETEADREYFAAAEAAFIRRRGTPFLLSPKDFAFLKEWRALGVPIEAIEQGIDDAFTHREERGAIGRVNSLSYCRDAVLAAWERQSEAAIGRGKGREEPAVDAAPTLAALASALGRIAEKRPDLGAPLESARRSLVRLGASGKEPSAVEESLARLDKTPRGCAPRRSFGARARPHRGGGRRPARARPRPHGRRDRREDRASPAPPLRAGIARIAAPDDPLNPFA